jgi:predicted PurR-regulated permease PerM
LTARRVFLDPSTPSSWSVIRVVLIVLLMLTVWNFLAVIVSSLTHLVFLMILSVFFAYLIDPLVKLIRRPFKERQLEKLMPRSLAIAISYLIVFIVLIVAISYLAPIVSEQAREFTANFQGYSKSVQSTFNDINRRFRIYQIPEDVQRQIGERVTATVGEAGSYLTAFLLNAVSYAPWLVLIPVLAFFFLKDVNTFRVLFLRIFPSGRWRSRVESVLEDVNTTLRAYARAQIISCLLIGTACTVGFYLLGLNYAVLLGITAGVLEFIPLLGPLTIGVLATIVASVSNSPWTGFYVAFFLIVLRILQDYVFYPRIVRGGIHLHPLAIILSVLAGEQVAGIPGVFIAIPLVALATVIYRHFLEHSGSTGVFAGWLEPAPENVLENKPPPPQS